MRSYRHYCFFDESGGIAQKQAPFVVHCVVVAEDRRLLDRIVRTTRRKHVDLVKGQPYLHAMESDPRVRQTLLNQAAGCGGIQFAACILDKSFYFGREKHPDVLYRELIGYTVQRALEQFGASSSDTCIVLEQMHTRRSTNDALVEHVSSCVDVPVEQIAVAKKDHVEWGSGVQIADFAAWSLFQKYVRADRTYCDLIQEKIVYEEVVGVDAAGAIKPVREFWK